MICYNSVSLFKAVFKRFKAFFKYPCNYTHKRRKPISAKMAYFGMIHAQNIHEFIKACI